MNLLPLNLQHELLDSFSPIVPFYRKSIECNLAGLSGISLTEVEEGNEPDEFWKAIGGKKYYCSLAHGNYVPSSLHSLLFQREAFLWYWFLVN